MCALVQRKVFVFFHICTIHHYRDIVAHISQRLRDSGLDRVVATLYYCLSGPDAESDIRDLLPHGWHTVALQRKRDRADFERLTLHAMAAMAEEAADPFYALYVHSKGVTKPHQHRGRVDAWRNMMLTFVADFWPLCLSALETDPMRAVSCNLHRWPSTHFSGNYWWTSSEHLRTLPTPIGPAYLDPEMWIGRGRGACVSIYQHPRWHCLFTAFDDPPYHNSAAPVDTIPEIPEINWEDVDEDLWWGRGRAWTLVHKTEWIGDGTQRTVSFEEDPCPNRVKMLLLRVRGRMVALLEGSVLRIARRQE